jgi:DNA-binding beta-propeller fold protein YncE
MLLSTLLKVSYSINRVPHYLSISSTILDTPQGIILNQQGTALFIVDKDSNTIQKLTLITDIMTTVAENIDGSYGLQSPGSIVLDLLHNLYVADTKIITDKCFVIIQL